VHCILKMVECPRRDGLRKSGRVLHRKVNCCSNSGTVVSSSSNSERMCTSMRLVYFMCMLQKMEWLLFRTLGIGGGKSQCCAG
jgi:hypothetical protein